MKHRKHLKTIINAIFILGLPLVLTACATQQAQLPTEPIIVDAQQAPLETEPADVQSHAFDQDGAIESIDNPIIDENTNPWDLVDQSRRAQPTERNALLLAASELFLDEQHLTTAFTMLEEIDVNLLQADQKTRYGLIKARYAFLSNDELATASRLFQIKNAGTMNQSNYIRWLQLDIALQTKRQNIKGALASRLALDALLPRDPKSAAEQIANQQRILAILSRNETVLASMKPQDPALLGWLKLAELKQNKQFGEPYLTLWRQAFPTHLARIDELGGAPTSHPVNSNRVALLLPLTSKLGRAAQAFKAGFDAAARKSGKFDTSRVYDTGSEADLISLYYQSAVNDGADFIIGPLGRAPVQSLLEHLSTNPAPGVSTLTLGALNDTHGHIPNLWGFSLAPEQDAAAIAEQAISQGFRQAVVMAKNNQWGARVSDAFRLAFQAKGGQIVEQQRFLPAVADHSTEVKNLLAINSSEVRHLNLQKLLGRKLKFSVRRRDDIDFIFLAGNAKDAKNIVPLAKFYRAHDLPIFATSSIYSGKFNKLTDEDMKGLQFSDLPWLLKQQAPPASGALTSNESTDVALNQAISISALPYTNATLNRLYALGYSAYESIPELSNLQIDQWHQFETETMSLRMDENRNLLHEVAWGEYTANGIKVSH